MDTVKFNRENSAVRMVAHRGVSGLETENTCAAFVAAGNRSYFGVETDVHVSADGQFIIFHDDNTKRVAMDSMIIEETSFDTLRKIQLTERDGSRSRGDLIMPTLEEYISICQRYEKFAVLELKNEFKASDIYRIMKSIEQTGYLDHVIIISFCLKNLIRLRKRYPEQKAQFLLSAWDPKHMESLDKYDLDLDIRYTAVTPELCQQIHEHGKEINCWTVDTLEDGQRMLACGVDYITSNILE